MFRGLLLVLFLLISIASFAGKITGTVTDSKDLSPLVGVTINIAGTGTATVTDTAGHYELAGLKDGSYELVISYVTYKSQTVPVIVAGDGAVAKNIALKSENNQLQGVSVRNKRVTHTETAVLNEIRKSSVAVSGISAAQIGKTMDRNAADVVKRIPGVTIQDDRFITVRGLADRYNTVWLNDAGAPSSEIDKKAFSFDLIPSGLIDRILVFKTPSPDLPGDFAGGMVKIYTTSLPARTGYTFGIQSSYRQFSTGTDFMMNQHVGGNWIGYDNKSRNLPEGTPDMIHKLDPNIAAISQSFKNDWALTSKPQPLDIRVSGSASNLFNFKKFKAGNTAGFSYGNTSTNYNVQRLDYEDTAKQYHYNDQQSVNKVNLALLDNLAVQAGNSKIEFRNLYNQIGTNVVTYRTNVRDSDLLNKPNFKSYLIGYENRRTYTSQLSGTHHNGSDSRKYNWTLGYTDLFRNLPDLKRITYGEAANAPGTYNAQVPAGAVDIVNGGGRYFAQLHEQVYSFNHQFTQKISIDSNFSFELNAGNYIEYKKRSFWAREIGYTLARNQATFTSGYLNLPVDQIFSPEHVGGDNKFNLDEGTALYDSYEASNKLIASYLSVNVPIGPRIKVLAGVRYEYNIQELSGYRNTNRIEPKITTNFFLPSVNATYNFSPKSLLRLAYGQTLNRPEFREWAPVYFYDFDQRAGTYGSLYEHTFASEGDTLKVAKVQNVDARYEWYPAAGEMIHAGVFYKTFNDPIVQVNEPGVSHDSKAFTYANGINAYVGGFELEVRKNLNVLDDRLNTGFFKNFVVVGNLALSKSELKMDSARITKIISKSTLQGQSNYVVNAGLFYQNDSTGWQGSLLYNVYGPRLYALGTTDGTPSIGELPFHSLDITLSKTIFRHYIINVGVQNLLSQSIRFVEDVNENNKFEETGDKPYSSWKPGRYVTLGVKVRF